MQILSYFSCLSIASKQHTAVVTALTRKRSEHPFLLFFHKIFIKDIS